MAAAKKALRVTAPLVEVKLGDRRARFYHGDVLPEGVDEESVKHLKSLGYVEDAKGVEAPAESDVK